MTTTTTTVAAYTYQRVYWNGSWFGRLTPSGRRFLLQHGWQSIVVVGDYETAKLGDNVPDHLLEFIWPNKSGPQFALDGPFPARVRPFPTQLSNRLDDKVHLQSLLETEQVHHEYSSYSLLPMVVKDVNDIEPDQLYFVKHRQGAQGKAVRVMRSDELKSWLLDQPKMKLKDYVIQQEIPSALDEHGHKFVLRAHVLVWRTGCDQLFRSALHSDVICHTQPLPYNHNSTDRNIHIGPQLWSSRGRKNTQRSETLRPQLIHDLPNNHPAFDVLPELRTACTHIVDAWINFIQHDDEISQHESVIAFGLFGMDFLVSNTTNKRHDTMVRLCEVNSHPALGWGTMSHVPKHVFDRLVEDTLSVILLNPTFHTSQNTRFMKLQGPRTVR